MTTHVELDLTAANANAPLPPLEVLRVLLDEQGVYLTEHSMDAGYRERRVADVLHLYAWWWDVEWDTYEGVQQACAALSERHPDVTIEVTCSWDTGDADEPGAEGVRYRDGRIVSTGRSEFRWEEES